jgi:hypothetical protein
MKVCKNCSIELSIKNKAGRSKLCKPCDNIRRTELRRTKLGLVSSIYGHQKASSIARGHNLPTYTKDELKDWLFSQELFHLLYNNWKILDYQKEYTPSVDRKDDYIGYTMSNIQIMTWSENSDKAHSDFKSGANNKLSKSVDKLTLDGEYICTYHSQQEAFRQTGIKSKVISRCVNGDRPTAGGYKWRHTDGY